MNIEVITVHIENIKTLECATYVYRDDNIMRFLTFLNVSLAGFKILSQQANTKLYDEYRFIDGWTIEYIERTIIDE